MIKDQQILKHTGLVIKKCNSLFANNRQGYQSVSTVTPNKDPTPDYKLTAASEENGYTRVEFNRVTTTDEEDDPHDVQFTVKISLVMMFKEVT